MLQDVDVSRVYRIIMKEWVIAVLDIPLKGHRSSLLLVPSGSCVISQDIATKKLNHWLIMTRLMLGEEVTKRIKGLNPH